MPGIEVSDVSISSPALVERPLLKSHKTLPRKRDIGPDVEVIQFFSDHPSPANGTAIETVPALPWTFPVATVEDNRSGDLGRKDESIKSDRRSLRTVSTPRAPHLTPDVTPPRSTSTNRPDVNQVGQSLSSSRAESFRTARETFQSDEDTDASYLSSRSLLQSRKNAGQRTPRDPYSVETSDSRDATNQPSIFDSLDGRWSTSESHTGTVVTPTQSRQNAAPTTVTSSRDHRLRDRVRDAQDTTPSAPVEKFGEEIGWPPAENSSSPPANPDPRRLSGVSTSTVEAIIIDSPSPAKRALRHTEKRLSLRSASSPISRSQRTSLASNSDSQRRLVHKAARITDQDRGSITSAFSNSASSTLGTVGSNVDVVPVVVIPERGSSLRGSKENSRSQSISCSQRSSQRTTAPRSRANSLDRPRQRSRTVSASRTDSKGRAFSQPIIPPRSSSLSAPTSRNNSRAASLTTESLKRYTMTTEPEQHQGKPDMCENDVLAPGNDRPGTQISHSIGGEYMGELQPPSLPFAQGSIHSLSPGPVEISEATMVTIFPHNNRSLLVVNQHMLPGSSVQDVRRVNFDHPHTPEMSSQAFLDVDSPLRNPRPPPKPPVSKALPPTPDDLAEESGNGLGPNRSFSHRFGSMRRALSARSRADSFNSGRRSFSTSATSRKSVKDIDSRLHSFWRPRRFWDDVAEGSNSGSPQKTKGSNTPEGNQIISNSLGMPQQRTIFEGPPCVDRRSPEMRRFVDTMGYPSRSKLAHNRVLSPGILRTQSPLHQRRFAPISRLRLRFRPIRLRNLRKRMRRLRQRRDEQKWEARRETLKQRIGDVVHVDSST